MTTLLTTVHKISALGIALIGLVQLVITLITDWAYLKFMFETGDWVKDNFFYHSLATFWLGLAAITWVIGGLTLYSMLIRAQKPLPEFLGWCMLAMAIFGTAMVPASALWLFIPQGIFIIYLDRPQK